MDYHFPESICILPGKIILNFYFLNMYISISLNLDLKHHGSIVNIAAEGTVSQIFDRGSGLFFVKFRKRIFKRIDKQLPVFCHKIKSKT